MADLSNTKACISLKKQIDTLLIAGRVQAAKASNTILVKTSWQIEYIVAFAQGGAEKSVYGSALLDRLSKERKERRN